MLLLMFCGGCTGSTAGGIKTSRVAILVKNAFNELRRFAHPKYVRSLKLDGKVVSEPVVRSVTVYFSVIIGIIIVSIILVSANGFDFESSLSAVFAAFSISDPDSTHSDRRRVLLRSAIFQSWC